jgi:carbon-monoxide dehydrogenase medium subunit
MRPVAFELSAPSALEDALAVLHAEPDSVLLAGGQTLTPLLNMRVVRPERIVDLSGVASLRGIARSGDELVIGAMTRQAELESPVVRDACPMIAHFTRHIGQPHTRSMGTVGGSIALGSSLSQLCVALLATDGRVKAERVAGARWIEAARLFTGYLSTALEPGEILTEVRFPTLRPTERWGFSEVKFRGCDFPIVVAIVVIELDGAICTKASIALGGVAHTPVRFPRIEAELVGRAVDEAAIRRTADAVEREIEPSGDVRASATYRKRVAAVQVAEALRQAALGEALR